MKSPKKTRWRRIGRYQIIGSLVMIEADELVRLLNRTWRNALKSRRVRKTSRKTD